MKSILARVNDHNRAITNQRLQSLDISRAKEEIVQRHVKQWLDGIGGTPRGLVSR